jgi:hypothetical protein
MVEEWFMSSAICFRMDIDNSQISNTASAPSISNTHNEPSTSQLISTDIATTSQPSMDLNVGNMAPTLPLVISDQSRVEILMRHREARWRRRRRRAQRRQEHRTEHPHQHLAHQIRRRQMANQQFQQQEYDRTHWYDQRQRQECQDRDVSDDVQSPSPTIDELFEEVIDDQLLELFDWDTIFSNSRMDQEELYQLEGIPASGQLSSVKEEVEQSQNIQAFEAFDKDEENEPKESVEQPDMKQLNETGNNTTSRSLHSIIYQLQQMQQNDEVEQ